MDFGKDMMDFSEVGSHIPGIHDKFGKIGYEHKECSSDLRESFRHAESLPMDPGYTTHAAAERTTPSELGDTAV